MKKFLAILMALTMVLALVACGGGSSSSGSTSSAPAASSSSTSTDSSSSAAPAASADPYADLDPVELIGGDTAGKGAAGQLLGEKVAELLDEITGGKLTMDYHPNGDLGGDADLIRQMQGNDIQIVVCQTAPIVSFIPEMAVFDLPMVFAKYDGDKIDNALNGDNAFTKALGEAYEAQGLHLLGFMQNATFRLTTSNKELNTLADFAGLQIRTMENANHMAFWQAIGAQPTPLAWGEVYISLQNKMIDAEENAADTVAGNNLQEVQKYLAFTNHILYCNQICISKEAYDALDPAYQAALEQAVAEAIAFMRPQLESIDKDNKALLEQKGMVMIDYDADFYDSILNLDGVKALYSKIDGDTNGLANLLTEALS